MPLLITVFSKCQHVFATLYQLVKLTPSALNSPARHVLRSVAFCFVVTDFSSRLALLTMGRSIALVTLIYIVAKTCF